MNKQQEMTTNNECNDINNAPDRASNAASANSAGTKRSRHTNRSKSTPIRVTFAVSSPSIGNLSNRNETNSNALQSDFNVSRDANIILTIALAQQRSTRSMHCAQVRATERRRRIATRVQAETIDGATCTK